MGSGGGVTSRRAYWIVTFALLLCAVSTAPVLADSPEEGPSGPPPPAVAEELEGPLPQEGAIAPPELAEFEREEEQQEEWLASPEAEEQREESWQAFGDVSAQESEDLLRTAFSEQLEALNSDPARFLSDAHIVQPLEETVAAVEDEGGKSLLAATVPLRTENEEGELAKVDVSLEPTPEGYETSNALSDVKLPSAASEAIEVGEEGFSITQAGASGQSSAHPFGDKNLLYPSVLPDTDLFVAPTANGAEIFDLLRSQESPEDLRFDIQVPEGAELRASGYGGAEVVRGEEILETIPTPTATDAQGTEVPVTLSVEEGAIVLHVDHHGAEYAAPILVDPIIEDWANVGANWYEGHNWAALSNGSWQPSGNNSNVHDEICCFEGHYAGLMVTFPANVFFGPEQFGAWVYQTPNNKSYIDHAWITPYSRQDSGCGSAQPHDYTGMMIEPGETWNPIRPNEAPKGGFSYDGYGMKFMIGMSSGPPGVWINCQRTVYAGGVALWMDDFDSPVLNSVTGIPSGWIKKDSTKRTINVSASDEGFGVQKIRLLSPGGKIWDWNQSSSCTGLWGNRCENSRSGQITYETSSFPFEGEVAVGVQPLDPLGKGANSQTYHLLLDGVSPTINLSGQLAGITEEKGEKEKPQGEGKDELSLPTYNMKIEAKDGSPTELRSGVKEIKVYLDKKTTPEQTETSPGCPQGSCPLTMNYKLNTVGLTADTHTLKIVAVDWAGNELQPERKVEFKYIPATGMKEEYVLQHIPLPDGKDHSGEDESHGPEIAVNVTNGNLVYHERDVKVQASQASLELERVYNSQLPTEKDTQWGHGWSVAQAPELKPQQGESPPQKATATKTSAITNAVNIPTSESQPTFSSRLHAEIGKTASGYEVAYKGGAEVAAFNGSGRIEEVRYGSNAPVTLEPQEELPSTTPTFISAFGSAGSGNGQLSGPRGLTADGKGHVWVIDAANNRVEEFSEAGAYIGQFGSAGTGDGQFSEPWGIAVTPAGNLWVVDTGNKRVEEFNAEGKFLQKFGTKASGSSKGTEFVTPEGIAIAPGGMIWVSDTGGGRIGEFRESVSSESERFVRNVATTGTGNPGLSAPMGLAVDSSGNLWATDQTPKRVLEYSPEGAFLKSFGQAGSGEGQLETPKGLAIGPEGDLYVVDRGNNRVEVFSPQGEFIDQFGSSGTGNGQFSEPRAIAIGTEGAIFVSDKGNNRVHRWAPGGTSPSSGPPTFISAFGSAGSGNGQLSGPRGLTADGKGHVWVIDAANNRVEEFSEAGAYIGQFGSAGTGDGQFSEPWGIAVTPAGNLWVVDTGNKRVEEFNAEGKFLQKFGTKASGSSKGTEFVTPEGIAIAPGGMIWVSDTGGGRIGEFRESVSSESERFVRNVATTGTGNPGLSAPMGLAVDSSGNLWATDQTPKRVLEYSPKAPSSNPSAKRARAKDSSKPPRASPSAPKATSTSSTAATTASRSSAPRANSSTSSAARAPATASSPNRGRSQSAPKARSSSPTRATTGCIGGRFPDISRPKAPRSSPPKCPCSTTAIRVATSPAWNSKNRCLATTLP